MQLETLQDLHLARVDNGASCTDEELDLSISKLGKEFSQLSSQQDPRSLRLLLCLANKFIVKANRTRSPDDLKVAIEHAKDAIMAAPSGHPQVDDLIGKLAALWKQKGDLPEYLESRTQCYQLAHSYYLFVANRPCQSPLERIQFYRGAAEFPLLTEDWPVAANYLKSAMELLPLIAPHSLSLEDLEYVL